VGSPKSKKPSTITEDSIDSSEETPVQRPIKKLSKANLN